MIIINGREIADKIKENLKKEVENLVRPPVLAVILVGNDPASILYVNIKEKTCASIGIGFKKIILKEDTKEQEILEIIDSLNKDDAITGIIIQLPLPSHIDTSKIINAIDPNKDVDGLTENSHFAPPTAKAIMEIFDYYHIDLTDKKICLVGYGKLVGKPLSKLLKDNNLNFDICTHETDDILKKTVEADVLISATGSPDLIKKNMVKKNAVVIDAGTAVEKKNNNSNKVMGDVDFENVKEITSYITPPKGGVGPMTVALLLKNVVLAAKNNN